MPKLMKPVIFFVVGCILSLLASSLPIIGTAYYQIIYLRNEFPFEALLWSLMAAFLVFVCGVAISAALAKKKRP